MIIYNNLTSNPHLLKKSNDLLHIGIDRAHGQQKRYDKHHETNQTDKQKIIRKDAKDVKSLKEDRRCQSGEIIHFLFSEFPESRKKAHENGDDEVGERERVNHVGVIERSRKNEVKISNGSQCKSHVDHHGIQYPVKRFRDVIFGDVNIAQKQEFGKFGQKTHNDK